MVEIYIVKPYRFRFLKMLGWLMVGLGLMILGYLGKTYWVLSRSAPRLSSSQVLGVSVVGDAPKRIGFGDLFHLSTKADPAPKVSSREVIERSASLGLKERRSERKGKPTEFAISIPRLGIKNARVVVGVDGTNEGVYLKILKGAIAHFKGTALPGEEGNVFLFGHSMLPIIATSSYESIFTNLPKLRVGDLIKVNYQGRELEYQVRQTAVVDPKDVGVLQQPPGKKLLTLMTCIPPGFGSDRFIVVAQLY